MALRLISTVNNASTDQQNLDLFSNALMNKQHGYVYAGVESRAKISERKTVNYSDKV